jgi:decaprenyl-phosphate phosphoribosyltransferase
VDGSGAGYDPAMAVAGRTMAVPVARERLLAAAVAAVRPRQWTKNLLLFAGLVFAAKLGDASRWVDALTAFAAYCAASSAAYLVNDVRDADDDRRHPVKCRRPVASGALAPPRALALAAALAVLAFALAATLGSSAVALLAVFVGVQGAYNLGLKHVAGLDVVAIAGLFVVRAAAGADAVSVPISPWLLACTALLALFLALSKRRAELRLVGAAGRPALRAYAAASLDRLVVVAAVAAAAVYGLYAVVAHSPAMVATVPFVVFGLARYLAITRASAAGEEPEHVLLSDAPILAAVAGWVVTAALVVVVVN